MLRKWAKLKLRRKEGLGPSLEELVSKGGYIKQGSQDKQNNRMCVCIRRVL